MSKDATVAPTNDATHEAEHKRISQGLSELELQFVTFVHQHYMLHKGEIFSKAQAVEKYGFHPAQFDKLINSESVRAALEERGIDLSKYLFATANEADASESGSVLPLWKSESLTPQQLIVANRMLDLNDGRSNRKKLQDSGVSSSTWETWLSDPAFQAYIRARSEAMFDENIHEAHLALLDKVRAGDTKALLIFYEMKGIFTPAAAKGNDGTPQNLEWILVQIIEIITEEVDDPNVANRIGNRLRDLGNNRNLANAMVGAADQQISEPVVVKNREISPAIKSLLSAEGPEE